MEQEREEVRDYTEYIKLTRNSRGYSWDIKVAGTDDLDFQKLMDTNEKLINKYGGGEE
jgi:hypothetical protein